MTPDLARAILKLVLLTTVFFAVLLAMPLVTPTLGLVPLILLLIAFCFVFRRIAGEPERKRKAQQAGGAAGASPQSAAVETPGTKRLTFPPIGRSAVFLLSVSSFFVTWLVFDFLLKPIGQSKMSLWIGLGV